MIRCMLSHIQTLLQKTASLIEEQADLSHINSGDDFEKFVFQEMEKVLSQNNTLPKEIYRTGKLQFPDIVYNKKWGVEVKFSNSGKWDSLGNSIFEGTSVEGLDEIFVFFGKKTEKKIVVKYDLYENSITDVKVTHSPRFIINLDSGNESLFKKLNLKYNEFKNLEKSSKAKKIKDYFRESLKPGDEVWWIDKKDTATIPKLRTFNNLNNNEQSQLMVEAFILFPEVLSNSRRTKYTRVAPYWLTRHQVYNPSLRDTFSASGQKTISIPPFGEKTVSQIYENFYELSHKIHACLLNPNMDNDFFETIKEKWEEMGVESASIKINELESIWLTLIDEFGVPPFQGILPSDVYKAGLLGKN